MSMKVTRVHTWWTAEQADDVLTLLDELRDQIWESYREEIIRMRLQELEQEERDTRQGQLKLEGGEGYF